MFFLKLCFKIHDFTILIKIKFKIRFQRNVCSVCITVSLHNCMYQSRRILPAKSIIIQTAFLSSLMKSSK